MNKRKLEQQLFHCLSILSVAIICIVLFSIIGMIFIKALPALNLEFLLTPEAKTSFAGGVANALVGTIYIGIFSVLFAMPFAIGTAIYLQKYAKKNRFTYLVELFIDVLSGTPSIVIGAIGFIFLAWKLKDLTGGFTLLSGVLAVGVHIMPIMTRAIHESIKTVSSEIEEASYALGATNWETIENITLPSSMSGILSATIMGLGMAVGESAIIILTTGYSLFIPEIGIISSEKTAYGFKILPFQQSVGSLPALIYKVYMNPLIVNENNAFAAAFILLMLVVVLNTSAKLIMHKNRIGE